MKMSLHCTHTQTNKQSFRLLFLLVVDCEHSSFIICGVRNSWHLRHYRRSEMLMMVRGIVVVVVVIVCTWFGLVWLVLYLVFRCAMWWTHILCKACALITSFAVWEILGIFAITVDSRCWWWWETLLLLLLCALGFICLVL